MPTTDSIEIDDIQEAPMICGIEWIIVGPMWAQQWKVHILLNTTRVCWIIFRVELAT